MGADADITLWDPDLQATIRQDRLNHGSDYTPYEGMQITGWPVQTILRGHTIAKDDKPVEAAPAGRHLRRGTSAIGFG